MTGSLTFEVEADAAEVAVDAIAATLSDGALTSEGDGTTLAGFAASGDSVRGALEALASACPMPLSDDGTTVRIADAQLTAIDAMALGSGAGEAHLPVRERVRGDAGALPDAVALGYYEPARDYQAGLQRARRDGIGRREERIDLPAAVSAETARMLADDRLRRAWTERASRTARVPWRYLEARCGTRAVLDDGSSWRIAGWTLQGMALELSLRADGTRAPLPAAADAGRATAGSDAPAGATVLALVDLPALDDTLADRPRLALAAAGTGAGWRRAAVSLSLDGGASWQAAGATALPATMGHAATALEPGPDRLFDDRAEVEVELVHAGMSLAGADRAALIAGTNLALLGRELIQFGAARQVSPTRWRLGSLVRGRRGSEWARDGHVVGEPFVVIEAATLLPLDVPLSSLGTTVAVSAIGPGDDGVEAVAEATVVGRAVRPPAPVALTARRSADGDIRIAWTRRSRRGWPWLDGGDAPLGEDREAYRLTLTAPGGRVRVVEVAQPAFAYSVAAQAEDGALGAPGLSAEVVQLGTSAPSEVAATASWTW